MATLVTGATGFVGRQLISGLPDVIVTSRNRDRALGSLKGQVDDVIQWDPLQGPIPVGPDTSIETVINLMGEPVAEGRWTVAKKKRILDSRVRGTQNLIAGLQELRKPPRSFISASAVGIYGDQPDTIIDETTPPGTGYLADVCHQWESAAFAFASAETRVVAIRIGIVLGKRGGALGKMLPIFRLGLGGTLGNGSQYVPWIHVHDLVQLIRWSAFDSRVSGPINGTAPYPVTNSELTKTLATALKRPAFLPAPKFALKLALGEFADSLFFSQRAVPKAALDAGFSFEFERLTEAIDQILSDQDATKRA